MTHTELVLSEGLWEVDNTGLRIKCKAGLVASCESEQGNIPEHEHLANARLIAAAPKMLAVCKYAITALRHPEERRINKRAIKRLQAAIAEAESEVEE
jgi:hypothetical protein